MNYIGIKNCPEKALLVQSSDFQLRDISTKSLSYDCGRHLDFLDKLLALKDCFFPQYTLYYAFYAFLMGEDQANAKCQHFLELFKTIQSEGFRTEETTIAVTTDGVRLDGSHRSAIALMLGIETVPVKVYQWESLFSDRKIRHIREEIDIKRRCRFQRQAWKAYDRTNGQYLGEVVYTDVLSQQPKWAKFTPWRKSVCFQPIVALKDEASVAYVPESQLTFLNESHAE